MPRSNRMAKKKVNQTFYSAQETCHPDISWMVWECQGLGLWCQYDLMGKFSGSPDIPNLPCLIYHSATAALADILDSGCSLRSVFLYSIASMETHIHIYGASAADQGCEMPDGVTLWTWSFQPVQPQEKQERLLFAQLVGLCGTVCQGNCEWFLA